ncbi:lysine decarboxylase [Candidatus Micrarchaeota archaeon]|nr:lysine decarboxylase [Candidatus Micrarchaeota archaeon]
MEYKQCPVLVIDREINSKSARGKRIGMLVKELKNRGFSVMETPDIKEGETILWSNRGISCMVVEWSQKPVKLIEKIRKTNKNLPIYLMAEKLEVEKIPVEIVEKTNGYIWVMEDTMDFIAGRVEDSVEEYGNKELPPFFKELVKYNYEYKYAWHTPGHMGGVAFRKTPAGRYFFNFFGENVFRTDLSVSVPELGSLLEHSDVLGKAENEAAKTFGADRTYFVTNGTSTANKIVFHGCVTPGDIVLVDRNCHKSAMHAIIMTGAVPVYFIPTRNQYGIIGPIHNKEFEKKTIGKKLKKCRLIKSKNKGARLAIITNSTYDGLCYNIESIKQKLKDITDCLHFDEAWYGYANFHPMYTGRYAMHTGKNDEKLPAMFATQSTHKVLAAFSQGSMVHVKDGKTKIDHERFNEAFMMHTSTSPQYGIIASLDVASRMMDEGGEMLVDEAMEEAIEFRKKMAEIGKKMKKQWWFGVWQPDKIAKIKTDILKKNSKLWTLKSNEKWHGFGNLEKDHILLDPLKVTVITPGIKGKGMDKWGIPAGIVSAYLRKKGIVVEKTGHYSFLVLFTIGVTKGKSGTLLNALYEFRESYDKNEPIEDIFPELAEKNPGYSGIGLKELCTKMHDYFRKEKINEVVQDIYSVIPEQNITPAESYKRMVKGKVKKVRIKDLKGKISAAMIVPYPPGIPVIMPGEVFTKEINKTIDYLKFCEEFDNEFPGFENEMHGVMIEEEKGRKNYWVYCIS